jgi:hypothetical protein
MGSQNGNHNGMQLRVEQLLEDGLSSKEIARILKISMSTVATHKNRIRKKQAAQALCPVDVPGLETTHGTVQYKRMEDGTIMPVNWWARQRPEEMRVMESVVESMCERVKGKGSVKMRREKKTDSDKILAELDIYDPHVGMYAAEKYTRESNYTCDIAAAQMVKAAENITRRFDRPHEIVVVYGGDMMHIDHRDNKTSSSASNHVLDADTRFDRVVRYLDEACTSVVEIAASRARRVRIVVTPGNHDWHSCVWLARVMRAYYHNSPNVTVDLQVSPRKSLVWGDNLLVWTHGDKIRPAKWPMIIAAEFAKQWGKTSHRYLMLGHVHHKHAIAPVVVDEQAGLDVQYLAALCPSDAWHVENGYVGTQRGASGFEYHKKAGRISQFFYNSNI